MLKIVLQNPPSEEGVGMIVPWLWCSENKGVL